MTSYKPDGYNDLSAYLVVDDAYGLLKFLETVFQAEQVHLYEHEGQIVHCEVKIGDTILKLANANTHWPAIPTLLHLYVPDAQALYDAALVEGAVAVQPPAQREGEPDLRGVFTDPFGITWSISTQQEA